MSDDESESIDWKSLARWDPDWQTANGGYSLVGARIRDVGPIFDIFLPLTNKVTVLFGTNGVGKSHILRALKSTLNSVPLEVSGQNLSKSSHTPRPRVHVWIDSEEPPIFLLSQEVDPWDPWRALWAGVTESVTSQFNQMAEPLGFTSSLDSLVLDCHNNLVAPFLSLVISRSTPESDSAFESNLEKITRSSSVAMDPLTSLVTYVILELDIDGLTADDGSFNNSGDELVLPVLNAVAIARRLRYENSESNPSVALCLSPDGHSSYSEEIRRLLYAKIWPNHDAETVRRVIALFNSEAHRATSETDWLSEESVPEIVRSEILAIRTSAIAEHLPNGTWELINGLERPYLLYGSEWASLVEEVLGVYRTPHWATDQFVETSENPGPLPFMVLDESNLDATLMSIRNLVELVEAENREEWVSLALEAVRIESNLRLRNRARNRAVDEGPLNYSVLIHEKEENRSLVDSRLAVLAHRLTELVNEILPDLLPDAPELICQVAPLLHWIGSGPLLWTAIDRSGVQISVESLSSAEYRWAAFSIHLADAILQNKPQKEIVAVIDEPERALHRRAEEKLAIGFAKLVNRFGIRFIIASHSPAFLARTDFALHQVYRDSRGLTNVKSLPDNFHEWSEELGIGPTDLLQVCRGILLVEGEHELIILNETLGQELRNLRIEMLCMRGARALKSWDAQLIQRYTEVPILVLTDNDSNERISAVWNEAKRAHHEGRATLPIIQKLKTGGRGSEGDFLRELCSMLIDGDEFDRFHLGAFEKADIIEYLNPQSLSSRVRSNSWSDLRLEAGKKASSSSEFKQWLRDNYQVSFSAEALKLAAQEMDALPSEFTKLLDTLAHLTRR